MLAATDRLPLSNGDTMYIQNIEKDKYGGYTITYRKNKATHYITLQHTYDQQRWNYPHTTIVYHESIYKSLPYNGDLLNHHHHQQELFDQEYLPSLVQQWIISQANADLMSVFHGVHDVPEIEQWDAQYGTKTHDNALWESEIIRTLIKGSNYMIPPEDLSLYEQLFVHLENPNNIFKWGEKLNYMNDIMRVYTNQWKYINKPEQMIVDVLNTQFPSFTTAEKKYIITDFFDHPQEDNKIALSTLDASQTFFNHNKHTLQHIVSDMNNESLTKERNKVVDTYKL